MYKGFTHCLVVLVLEKVKKHSLSTMTIEIVNGVYKNTFITWAVSLCNSIGNVGQGLQGELAHARLTELTTTVKHTCM